MPPIFIKFATRLNVKILMCIKKVNIVDFDVILSKYLQVI